MRTFIMIAALCSCAAMLLTACANAQNGKGTKQYASQTEQEPVTAGAAGESGLYESKADTEDDDMHDMKLKISVGGTVLTAELADSAAAKELAEKLAAGSVTVTLNEYGGFEKVGKLPWTLTRTDESVVTEAGDIMLYQGDQMTIFYGSNSWSYTRLGHIDDITGEELAKLFGDGNITAVLSY